MLDVYGHDLASLQSSIQYGSALLDVTEYFQKERVQQYGKWR
jgi:hypothetical protein